MEHISYYFPPGELSQSLMVRYTVAVKHSPAREAAAGNDFYLSRDLIEEWTERMRTSKTTGCGFLFLFLFYFIFS